MMTSVESVFTALNAETFQDLVAAIVVRAVDSKAQRMGPGPDGGRDVVLKQAIDGSAWFGYTVFQAKFRADTSERNSKNAIWLVDEIRKELRKWLNPFGDRGEVPDRIVFVTNVPLSPAPRTGGLDKVWEAFRKEPLRIASELQRKYAQDPNRDRKSSQQLFQKIETRRKSLEAAEWLVWDANQISGFLDAYPNIRSSFPALWAWGDAFASLSEYFDTVSPIAVGRALRDHARSAFSGNADVFFDEAGDAQGNGFPLHQVVIDIPLMGTRESVLASVLRRAEMVLKPSLTSVPGPRHFVLSGSPGNGKTTISRFLVQAFRASFLAQGISLSEGQERLSRSILDAFDRLMLDAPVMPRWPMYVNLAEFAASMSEHGGETLLGWMSRKISSESDTGQFTATQLKRWTSNWPTLLVLDGLDEVVALRARRMVISRIVELAEVSEAEDADVLMLVTTRSTGYVEDIAPELFQRLNLDLLEPGRALEFGMATTSMRLKGDRERRALVVKRLEAAFANSLLVNLLRTPLQVLMITIISESEDAAYLDRYGLFTLYFETVFKRERGKIGATGELIRNHSKMVIALHEHVGLTLHREAEHIGADLATITHADLVKMARRIVKDFSEDPNFVDTDAVDSVVLAVTHRLVLLAPREGGGFGFDVLSLQELMAARSLSNLDENLVLENLRHTAASPHWRSVWLFIAGRILQSSVWDARDRFLEFLVSIDVDAAYRLGRSVPVAPTIALQILEDGNCRDEVRWRRQLINIATGVFRYPGSSVAWRSVRGVLESMPDTAEVVERQLATALNGSAVQRVNVESFREFLHVTASGRNLGAGVERVRSWRPEPGPVHSPPDHWHDFETWCLQIATDDMNNVISLLKRLRERGRWEPSERDAFIRAVTRDEITNLLDERLCSIVRESLMVGRVVMETVEKTLHRAPVGELLLHRYR